MAYMDEYANDFMMHQLHQQNQYNQDSMYAQDALYGQPGQHYLPPGLQTDVKPRLTKEQHDILEAHYQQQSKPNTQTKKGFAESLGVSLDKVNVRIDVRLTRMTC